MESELPSIPCCPVEVSGNHDFPEPRGLLSLSYVKSTGCQRPGTAQIKGTLHERGRTVIRGSQC